MWCDSKSGNSVGILADDMTGSLDTAARLAALAGPISVLQNRWPEPEESFAINSNTRECTEGEASRKSRSLASHLNGRTVAFKKIDSLLRGHAIAELLAVMEGGGFDRCLLAPAFPEEGRFTIDGQQWLVHQRGRRERLDSDLVVSLIARGVRVVRLPAGASDFDPKASVVVCDATTTAHLRNAVKVFRKVSDRALYCGTAGLAGALAPIPEPRADAELKHPILAVIGSIHPVTLRQLDRLGAAVHSPQLNQLHMEDSAANLATVRSGVSLLNFDFAPGISRTEAERRICAAFSVVAANLPPPKTLFVVGGETLACLAKILGVDSLVTQGEFEPGVPLSRIVGGQWDGTTVVSKSGAFGKPEMLLQMLAVN